MPQGHSDYPFALHTYLPVSVVRSCQPGFGLSRHTLRIHFVSVSSIMSVVSVWLYISVAIGARQSMNSWLLPAPSPPTQKTL